MTDISIIPFTFLTLLRDETCEDLAANFIIVYPTEALTEIGKALTPMIMDDLSND